MKKKQGNLKEIEGIMTIPLDSSSIQMIRKKEGMLISHKNPLREEYLQIKRNKKWNLRGFLGNIIFAILNIFLFSYGILTYYL